MSNNTDETSGSNPFAVLAELISGYGMSAITQSFKIRETLISLITIEGKLEIVFAICMGNLFFNILIAVLLAFVLSKLDEVGL